MTSQSNQGIVSGAMQGISQDLIQLQDIMEVEMLELIGVQIQVKK